MRPQSLLNTSVCKNCVYVYIHVHEVSKERKAGGRFPAAQTAPHHPSLRGAEKPSQQERLKGAGAWAGRRGRGATGA